MGISRGELRNCELRASASGFRDGVISLIDLDTFGNNIDVGAIVVQRATKIEGMTLSATPYKAPKDARRAYEKGLEAERNGKLANARKYFETAVEIYPNYANAWFQLGTVLEKENQKDAARAAYTQATTIDNRFLPPYLSLASMAYHAENWTEVLSLTEHILDLDPLNHAAVTGYIVDPDPLNCAMPISITRSQTTSSTTSQRPKRAGLRRNTWPCSIAFRSCISYWLRSLLEKTNTPLRCQRFKFTWS